MENSILTHTLTVGTLAAIVSFIGSGLCGLGVTIILFRASRQATREDNARKKQEDDERARAEEERIYRETMWQRIDEIFDCIAELGKDFAEHKGILNMLIKTCDKNHGR
jgi:hypothetical protein